ncbi:putative secreted protein [Proteiniphilum saccharofermentans]|uniref:Putative secreted protein n=1 Tax=Proteiniphilum saccharofermentans TaxID=1642647 RepID=A0A1R3T5U4_9BACT|nr:hypothetical protein [Proteiniphilum saccharofermentans]SCD21572.1 putative secreted protein [Proteiniphilum saccharofermentans]
MRNSLFVSIAAFCLLATSCASSIRSGCRQAETVSLTRADIPSVIEASDSLQTFDMEISFFGKHLNGMMLVKRQDRETVRILINSYFGMSMADFELRPDTFVIHYLLDAMNKPPMVNLFKNNFTLLFGAHLPEHFVAQKSLCRQSEELISAETPNGKYQYRINREDQKIIKIKAPGVNVEVPYPVYPFTITLKYRGIFGPTIVIREME